MSVENKIPTTLPAKQAKLMAFIDYYHQQLVDNNIITDRNSLDNFSKLFSQDITDQISFCNSFFDYEQSHIKLYKDKTKKNKQDQKTLLKKQAQQDKLFIKSYKQLKDPKKWNQFLQLHTNSILQILPQNLQHQDLRSQNPLSLLPLENYQNYNQHPLYTLLTQNTTPPPIDATPPPPSTLNITKNINKYDKTDASSMHDMVAKILAACDD